MTFYDAISDGNPIFITALPNERGGNFMPRWTHARNSGDADAFVGKHDGASRGIFYAAARLRPDAEGRSTETLKETILIWADVDFKDHPDLSADEIYRRLTFMPNPPSMIIGSGHGYQCLWWLREPVELASEEGRRRVTEALKLVCGLVGGDPAVCEPARLLRWPGSTNTKFGHHLPVEIKLQTERRYDLDELVDCWLDMRAILPEPVKSTGNGHDRQSAGDGPFAAYAAEHKAPVDVEARLAAMQFQGSGETAIHTTQLSCTASLLFAGTSVEEATAIVLEATRRCVANDPRAENWDWIAEERDIKRMCTDMIRKNPELVNCLPEPARAEYEEAIARGLTPRLKVYGNTVRVCVYNTVAEAAEASATEVRANPVPYLSVVAETKEPPKPRFRLYWFDELRPGMNEQHWLVEELFPMEGLAVVYGKYKSLKSFLMLDIALHIAMGWEYRDRAVQQGLVIYCAFEGAHGYGKRVEAMRRHYNLPDRERLPLCLMSTPINLIKEYPKLVAELGAQLGDKKPALVVLDTLNRSLVGSESKDVDMAAYIAAATAIKEAFKCLVVIIHHCGWDESRPRGHSSLPGAVDGMLAVERNGEIVTLRVEAMRDGPEEIEIASTTQKVIVGEDIHGSPIDSLVVVPYDGVPPTSSKDRKRWTGALAKFHTAMIVALKAHGLPYHVLDEFSKRVHAVNLEYVREAFYERYAVDGDNEAQKQDARKHAFARCRERAERYKLIEIRVEPAGLTRVWFTHQEDFTPSSGAGT
jgi:hypothetical protein